MVTQEQEWTVGELARAAGVTVRTLHHYDRIGLLVPSSRSSGGHRRYSSEDVSRLYRIVALRSLGFGLNDAAEALDSGAALLDTARRQLAQLDQEIGQRRRIRKRLSEVVLALQRSVEPSPEELLGMMEAISMTIRLDSIRTGTGDDGQTDLVDGQRVAKTDPSLEVADLEELGAHIGVALAAGLGDEDRRWLERVQNDLFDLAHGTTGPDPADGSGSDYVDWLAEACAEANDGLPPLDSFVLAGGGAAAAQLHVCRTVCRRLERWAWGAEPIHPQLPRYLNRLSDLLFILSRRAGRGSERLWQPGGRG